MAKKKGHGGNKSANDDAGTDNKASIKIDMHCEGCIRDIENCLWNVKGVESLQTIGEKNTVNVEGNKDMNPLKLIERLEKKTGKKPTLLSLVPKNNKDKKNANPDAKQHDQNEKDPKKKPEDEVLIIKIDPPCDGCFSKTTKLIKKTKGKVKKMEVSSARDSIIVKGTKNALELLKEKLPKTVKAAPPPPPKKDGASAGKDNSGGGGKRSEVPMVGRLPGYAGFLPPGYPPEFGHVQLGYPPRYGSVYPYGYPVYPQPPAPQIFSDENPLACSVM